MIKIEDTAKEGRSKAEKTRNFGRRKSKAQERR